MVTHCLYYWRSRNDQSRLSELSVRVAESERSISAIKNGEDAIFLVIGGAGEVLRLQKMHIIQ